jgi:hypothetical protein
MRSAVFSFALTVVACMALLGACFNKGKSSSPGFDAGYPDVLLPGVNIPDAGTKRYTVGGTVLGLKGTGLVLYGQGPSVQFGGVTYHLSEPVTVAPLGNGANVPFTFQTAVPAGFTYQVSVMTQPSGPTQNCTVMSGSGTVPHGNVTGIVVNCSTKSFVVGGTATGVLGSGLLLEDNGGDMIAVNTNGSFAFKTPIPSGGTYAVTVLGSPISPSETCKVTMGSGTVTTANVTGVKVNCYPNVYNVGGKVVGLTGSGLVLTDNATDNLNVSANGAFNFAVPVPSGSMFSAQITTQPSNPAQVCTIAGQAGTVGSGDVNSILVNCTANAYTVSGQVNNLAGGGLVLNTSAGSLTITSNGSFALPASFMTGEMYSVAVGIQPANPPQTCGVTGGTGVIAGASVNDVVVDCSTSAFTIGGQVSGLAGNTSVVLTDNGGDNLTITSNGGFTFATPVAGGTTYDVAVGTQPYGQGCTVSNGGPGLVMGSVTGVLVQCSSGDYCVDGQTDPANCGFCGHSCPTGQVCQRGICECPTGETACGTTCVSTATDAKNCGGCGRACGAGQACESESCVCTNGGDVNCNCALEHGSDPKNCGNCGARVPRDVCPTGATCQTTTSVDGTFSTCHCPPQNSECGSRVDGTAFCADLTTDSSNCGTCGNACPNGLSCANGSCCPAGQALCGSTCLDDTADPNCGGCGVNCSQGGATCQAGACVCPASDAGPTQTYCSGTGCTDTTADSNNCGACGNACLGGATCQGGSCVCGVTAGPPFTYCSAGCTSLATDNNNCGGCGIVCNGASTCQGSVCTCTNGAQTYCSAPSAGCTDTTTDPNNCGGCNTVCGGTLPLCCSPDGSACVDGATDTSNCGTCGNVCPGDPNGTPACSSGSCEVNCNVNFIGCPASLPTACVDPTTNANCGSCGNACTGAQTCQNGACACPGGQVLCNGNCVDESTDANNCGACGTTCPVGVACQNGSCCPAGQSLCSGTGGTYCIDVTADSRNCGGCGVQCPGGTACANGSCCSGGQVLCPNSSLGQCVDTLSDPNNCGPNQRFCGNTCPAGTACTSGRCCGSGQLLCGPNAVRLD